MKSKKVRSFTIKHTNNDLIDDVVSKIRALMASSRKIIFRDINNQSLKTYWQIGQYGVNEGSRKVRASTWL